MNLNKSQLKVIESDFPILNIAGAGSGKTATLIEKINSIIKTEEDLKKVLILTFTNKAANVILERLNKKLGLELDRKKYYTGTYHSIFFKILRENYNLLQTYFNFKKNIKVIETDDDLKIFKQSLKIEIETKFLKQFANKELETFVEEKYELTIKDIYYKFAKKLQEKNSDMKLILKQTIKSCSGEENDELLNKSFNRYISTKLNDGIVSFNDILYFMYSLLTLDIVFKYKLQNTFKYICIDEYQDTNEIQDGIVENIVSNGNLYIVGDPDQSIYGFLGAKIENIINIKNKFNMNVIQLTENYRSTPNIVAFSNDIKSLFTSKIDGLEDCVSYSSGLTNNKIKLIENCNQENEIVKDILERIKVKKIPPNEIAVLARTNFETFIIEKKFRENGLKYKKLGGKGLYDLKYIKEIYSLLKIMSLNYTITDIENTFENFEGVGKSVVEKVSTTYAKNSNKNLYDIIKEDFKKNKKLLLANDMLFDINELNYLNFLNVFESDVFKLKHKALNATSVDTMSKKEEIKNNINYVLKEIEEVLSKQSKKELEEYLSVMTLNNSADKDDEGKIVISTVHSAKGLEWNNCYILNAENGKFPSQKSLGFKKEIEEEKRLFYVACSRAKENLMITSRAELNEFLEQFKNNKYVEYISKLSSNSGWFNNNYY